MNLAQPPSTADQSVGTAPSAVDRSSPTEPGPTVPSAVDRSSPTEPGPTEPGPTEPGPTEPGPTEPGPTVPGPADQRRPTEPGPTVPGPADQRRPAEQGLTEPGPAKPRPTEPGPADQRRPAKPGMAISLEDRLAALPRVDAFGVDAPTGLSAWFGAWTRRHTLVTLAAIPLFHLMYGGAVGSFLPGNALVLASLVLASVLGALVAATYLPTAGRRDAATPTPCAAGALFPVLLATFLFQGSLETPVSAAIAAVLVGAGLAQRVFGAGACAV